MRRISHASKRGKYQDVILPQGKLDYFAPVWSKNSNALFSQCLRANHRPLLVLQSTALSPILTTYERQRLEWHDTWTGSNCWRLSRAPSIGWLRIQHGLKCTWLQQFPESDTTQS